MFIGGSDEHGIPITIRAKKEGVSPKDIADRYHSLIKKSFEDFGISFDYYSRTSDALHKETASEFFTQLYQNQKFIEETSDQFYDELAGEFLADRYITGDCPKCNEPGAYGDQCEKCGSSLSPRELLNPKSSLSGNKPILKQTKHWYLPLEKYQDFLGDWMLKEHAHDWKTNVLGQVKSWLDDGLKPRAITRDLDWGVPVPLADAKGKVLYVWFDAPIGYISATKQWAEEKGENWEPFWRDQNTELIHFIGKDNIVFHCIVFPAMLKAQGSYILPTSVPANEFLNLENQKISTSRNWAVWLHEYLEDFKDKQDVLRFVLTANMPEAKDNNFTWKDFQTKNNSELVGILGNFINRVVVLTHKYYDGVVPSYSGNYPELQEIKEFPKKIGEYLEKFEFRNALGQFLNLARLGNQFLQVQEPWKKTDSPKEVQDIMYVALQIAGMLAQLSEPFLPFTSEKLLSMLGLSSISWDEIAGTEMLPVGSKINEGSLLFEKIEDKDIEFQLQKLEKSKQQNMQESAALNQDTGKEICSFDDFQKLELRVGKILSAQKVEKADRLLLLKVDLGNETRTIVSGIAESFSPEEVIGKQVMVLANLAPRKIKGIESQGMLLLTEDSTGKMVFMTPENSGAEVLNGTEIG
ncbi:MAG: methionine--tRNA ligase [Flavobacteriaceae bacterium]|nr:MAG: methionine--tRNA ligase [Flavobacteriaceae bacterium]